MTETSLIHEFTLGHRPTQWIGALVPHSSLGATFDESRAIEFRKTEHLLWEGRVRSAKKIAVEELIQFQVEVERLLAAASRPTDLVSWNSLRRLAIEIGMKDATFRTNMIRWEKEQFVSPSIETGNERLFSSKQARRILLALLLNKHGLTRSQASGEVEFLETVEEPAGATVVMRLATLALDQLENDILSRIVLAVAAAAGGRPRPGTVVILRRLVADDGRMPRSLEQRHKWVAKVLEGEQAKIGIVTEASEIVFARRVADIAEKTQPQLIEVQHGRIAFLIALFAPGSNHHPDTTAKVSVDSRALAMLLSGVLDGLALLRNQVPLEIHRHTTDLRRALERVGDRSILLWLATRLVGQIFSPGNSHSAGCLIFGNDASSTDSRGALIAVAESNRAPWDERTHPVTMLPGQFLSGFTAATRLALAVEETSPPWSRLVSYLHEEIAIASHERLSCLTVPIPTRDGATTPVLYAWMPRRAGDEITAAVHALQVLAPAFGEIIERAESMNTASRCAAAIAQSIVQTPPALEQSIVDALIDIQNRPVDTDERLVFILLRPSAGAVEDTARFARWLGHQFRLVSPEVFLGPWLQAIEPEARPNRFVVGRLDKGLSAVIFIPRPLPKEALDRLRALLPTHLNDQPAGFTQGGDRVAGLNVWIVDERVRRLRADLEGSQEQDSTRLRVEALAKELILTLEQAGSVLEDTVQTYQRAYRHGDFDDALTRVESGLYTDPENPYLLRRGAELSLIVGNLDKARRFAQRAVQKGPSVTAHCLRGDIALACGSLSEAIDAYREAVEWDEYGNHPLPNHCLGWALVILAEVVQRRVVLAALDIADPGSGKAQNRLVTSTMGSGEITQLYAWSRYLADSAEVPLLRARALLRRWGTPEVSHVRNYFEVPCAFGLGRIPVLRNDLEGTFAGWLTAKKDHPHDDLFYRQLIVARLSRPDRAAALCQAISDLGGPEGLVGAMSKVRERSESQVLIGLKGSHGRRTQQRGHDRTIRFS